MSIYDFKAITIDGDEVSLERYKGKVLVIVNRQVSVGLHHSMRVWKNFMNSTRIKISKYWAFQAINLQVRNQVKVSK